MKYNGPLHLYKASAGRMPATLAVSYRWQEGEGVELKEGVQPLNMSEWQMAALLSELRASPAAYCWIDCLAVPQQASKMKQTLLARMQAVYAGAGAGAVVLRSYEEDGNRYHQVRQQMLEGRVCESEERKGKKEEGGGRHEQGKEQETAAGVLDAENICGGA